MDAKTKRIEIEDNKTIIDLTLNNVLLKRITIKRNMGKELDVKVYDIKRGIK